MPAKRIRELVDSLPDSEPETIQFLTHADPDASLFHQLFSIDLRSLALLRIATGLILIGHVLSRFSSVEMLYCDDGVLDRTLNQQLLGEGFWSIYWFNGSSNFAQLMLIITGLSAGSFVLGFQARLMNLVCLVLLWSLQVRNPLLLTGGGVLLRMLLFWMLFLPTAAVWSVDANRAANRPTRWVISSVATLAIMLQVIYMYFFSGLAKLNPFWISGDAIEYALHLEMSVKPLGEWIRNYPGLLRIATILVLVAELLTLLLMNIPRLYQFNRGALMGFFWIMHIAIWSTMSIGLFSITAMIAWIVFVPSDIWNIFVGEPVGFSEKRQFRRMGGWLSRSMQIVCGFFLVYVTLQNLAFAVEQKTSIRFDALQRIGRATMTIQKFHMFAEPPLFSPWFEYPAQLKNGDRADLFSPRHKSVGEKPESVYRYMRSQTFRRLHWNLLTHPLYPPESELIYGEIRKRLLLQMVDRWNDNHLDDPVLEAELICHLEPIQLHQEPDAKKVEFANHEPRDLVWAVYVIDDEISR
jgi:hypothetical protein